MRIRVYPYKQGSRSARALADALGGRVLKLEGSRFRPRASDVIVGWGASDTPFLSGLNTRGTATASNKLSAFNVMQAAGVSIPEFWTDATAIPHEAFPIVCRTVLNGHSGRGIHIADDRASLVAAPLYVRYVKKQDEYRVHVMNGEIICVQRKARRLDVETPDWRVRNHANGFNFARDGVVPPTGVTEQSIMAVAALGLDFGAVDVIWNARQERAYVLEINTAPGLEGTTVTDYAEAIRAHIARGRLYVQPR